MEDGQWYRNIVNVTWTDYRPCTSHQVRADESCQVLPSRQFAAGSFPAETITVGAFS